jgi:hypothetical protein
MRVPASNIGQPRTQLRGKTSTAKESAHSNTDRWGDGKQSFETVEPHMAFVVCFCGASYSALGWHELPCRRTYGKSEGRRCTHCTREMRVGPAKAALAELEGLRFKFLPWMQREESREFASCVARLTALVRDAYDGPSCAEVGQRKCDFCAAAVSGPGLLCPSCLAGVPEQPLPFVQAAIGQAITDLDGALLEPMTREVRAVIERATKNARVAYDTLGQRSEEDHVPGT